MTTIRFQQANLIFEKKDVIKVCERKFQEIMRLFSKSPLMQLKASDLWFEIIELSEPVSEGDYSNYLLKRLDDVFVRFEELQSDERFSDMQDSIIRMIAKCNELGIDIK